MPQPKLEDALKGIEEKAAVLRHLAYSAALNPDPPDPLALNGIGALLEEIEDAVRLVKEALGQ